MPIEWSKAEKVIARTAFELALTRRCEQLITQVNNTHAESIDDVWALLETLQTAQKAMQTAFDFRYSQLDMVFPKLIHDGLLSIEELAGLSQQRLDYYRQVSSFLFAI